MLTLQNKISIVYITISLLGKFKLQKGISAIEKGMPKMGILYSIESYEALDMNFGMAVNTQVTVNKNQLIVISMF